MILNRLSAATSVSGFRTILKEICFSKWRTLAATYVPYDPVAQMLQLPLSTSPLLRECQFGQCGLSLRSIDDQSLSWPEELSNGASQQGYRSCFPALHLGSLVGIFGVALPKEPDRALLNEIQAMIEPVSLVGHFVQQKEKMDRFLVRVQELLVHAVETQGRAGHVGRVSRVSVALATMLDCSSQSKAELLQAAQYHDVGLLSAVEPGSPKAIREHPKIGANILSCHPDLQAVAPIVEAHHERFDGSGVPHGRSGHDLPLEAWILSLTEDLVESWESSDEPYEVKLRTFFQSRAKHHHPDVVDALCGLIDSERLKGLLEDL